MKSLSTISDMSKPDNEQPQLRTRHWAMISGVWVLIALATALQNWLTLRVDFWAAMRFAASLWLPWALLTPAVAWLSTTFSLERKGWKRALAAHLAGCAIVSVLLAMLSYYAGPPPFLRPPVGASDRPPFLRPPVGTSDRPPFLRPPVGASERPLFGPPIREMILRRAIFQLPIYCAIVGVAQAFSFYERARERERHAAVLESRLTKARLHGLQMQLNPHFLFNTLNSIASLIHQNPRVADEMIGSLSEFLRVTLKTSDRAEVKLREELEYLDHYLSIEQIRFGERLRVEKQIDPAALDVLVPVLILQPLVENAIKHGIEKQIAPGLVRITAMCSNGRLCLQVTDNGRGLRDSPSEGFKEGIGLSNIRARLSELAGAAAALELRTAPGGGVVAEIQLPCSQSTSIAPA